MSYSKTTWTNGSGEAINAVNLNHIETGIDEAHSDLAAHVIDTSTHGVSEVADVATVSSEIDSDITTHAADADVHHNEVHTIVSHDTTVTGAELNADHTKLGTVAEDAIANIVEDATPQLGGDLDGQGNYLVNIQNIPDLASNGACYGFNEDYIEVSNDDAIDFGSEDFSIVISIDSNDVSQGNQGLLDKHIYWTVGSTGQGFLLGLVNKKVNFEILNGSARNGSLTPDNSILNDAAKYTICAVRNSESGGSVNVYINGKDQVLTQTTGTDFDADVSNAIALRIGYGAELTRRLNGSLYDIKLFNKLLSENEVKALSSGIPVPYKYVGASQTPILDFDFSSSSGWSLGGCAIAGGVLTFTGTGYAFYSTSAADQGKKFRVNYDVISDDHVGSDIILGGDSTNKMFKVSTTLDLSVGSHSFEVDGYVGGTGALFYLEIATLSSGSIVLDNISVTQIGCVLQLEQSGIGHNQWLDNSGNELNGEVSGAISTNLPPNHVERVVKKTVTADALWTEIVPEGYTLERMIFEETAGNAATLDLGTTDGGNDIFTGEVIVASSITVIEINKMFSSAQTLDLNDDQVGSSWNSASMNVTIMMRRVS